MPRPPRFFISPDQVNDLQITLSGEDVRHIGTVLRMKTGDELLLCDGKGVEYQATIAQVTKAGIIADVKTRSQREINPPFITLCQGMPKFDKMDWVVQKATELGVATIVPLITERTIVKIKDGEKRVARWQKIAREAAMQSNRPDIPKVGAVISYKDFLRTEPALECPNRGNSELPTLRLLPWEEGMIPIKEVLQSNRETHNIVVLIGPEGGFSSTEAAMAKEKGYHLVSLGPNILRTETAAIAALSMIGYETNTNIQMTNIK